MKGGELLDRIMRLKCLSERDAASIMYTITRTIAFLHQEGVSEQSTINLVFNRSFFLSLQFLVTKCI